jgi:hypothetical protein
VANALQFKSAGDRFPSSRSANESPLRESVTRRAVVTIAAIARCSFFYITEPFAATCAFLRHLWGTDDTYELIDARRCISCGYHAEDEPCPLEGSAV